MISSQSYSQSIVLNSNLSDRANTQLVRCIGTSAWLKSLISLSIIDQDDNGLVGLFGFAGDVDFNADGNTGTTDFTMNTYEPIYREPKKMFR